MNLRRREEGHGKHELDKDRLFKRFKRKVGPNLKNKAEDRELQERIIQFWDWWPAKRLKNLI